MLVSKKFITSQSTPISHPKVPISAPYQSLFPLSGTPVIVLSFARVDDSNLNGQVWQSSSSVRMFARESPSFRSPLLSLRLLGPTRGLELEERISQQGVLRSFWASPRRLLSIDFVVTACLDGWIGWVCCSASLVAPNVSWFCGF